MTLDADITNVRFTISVIASKAAFTYEEAQIRKDDPFVFSLLMTPFQTDRTFLCSVTNKMI
jgi:exosome complex exonuclease DIS3/RRP44